MKKIYSQPTAQIVEVACQTYILTGSVTSIVNDMGLEMGGGSDTDIDEVARSPFLEDIDWTDF